MSYSHREYRPDGTYWVSMLRDDTTRAVTTYDETGALTSTRPYTAAENATADAAAAASAAQQVAAALTTDAAADEAKIAQAIANLLILLGDDTQAGSIRSIVGPSGATAGTTSLRALRTQSNTAVINAASIKALISLTIDLAQRVIDDAQATRKIARQTLRLARLATGDYSTADVGADV